MKSSLRLNSVFTLTSNIVLAFSNWFILILIAKAYTAIDLGNFVLALSIASTGILLASFKLRTLLIVDINWDFGLESYAMSRLLANFAISILSIWFTLALFSELPIAVFICVLLYKWADSVSEFAHSYARRNNRFDYVTKVTILRSLLTIAAIATVAIMATSILNLLAVWALVAWVFAIRDIMFVRHLIRRHRTDSFKFKKLFSFSALSDSFEIFSKYKTIALSLVVSALFVSLPNFMLSKLDSVQMAGVFASISYFLVAGGIIINSLSQAATPTLTNFVADKAYHKFIHLTRKLCIAGVGLGVAGLLVSYFFGQFFLQLFYNEEVAKYFMTLNWVMLAALIRYVYIFLGTSFSALNQFNIQTKIYSAGLVTLAVCCFYLIPQMGIEGGGLSLVIATLVELTLYLIASARVFSIAKKEVFR